MKKRYIKPVILTYLPHAGLPTVAAVALASAAASAAAVGVSKLIGDDRILRKETFTPNFIIEGASI